MLRALDYTVQIVPRKKNKEEEDEGNCPKKTYKVE
jgi:hypothetical protein